MMKRIITIVIVAALSAAWQFPAMAQPQPHGPNDLKTLNLQLQDLYRKGNYAEAIPIAQRILYITELYGAPPVETTVALNNLALLYIVKGRYDEAEYLSKKALHIFEYQLGMNQPAAASTHFNLAEIYEKTGRPVEAERFYRKSTEIRNNTKGMVTPAGSLELERFQTLGPIATPGLDTSPPKEYPEPAPTPEEGFPQAIPAKDEQVSAFWNTWFENRANGKRVEELKKGYKYSIVFDISRLSYFKDYAVAVGSRVQEAIKKVQDRGAISFTIRPILHGNLLRFTDNHPTSLPLDVDIKKLLKPKDVSAREEMERKEDEWKAGRIELHDFARVVHAGEVAFEVEAKRPGDARISVTIWDQSGMIPLDHLTLSVRVTDEQTERKERSPASQTVPLKAGWGNLLDVSFNFSSTGSLVADAAFYIFEPGPEGNSVILFVAGKKKKEKEDSKHDQGVSVYAWETTFLLSDYIERKEAFLNKINHARVLAIEKKEYPYQEAASELCEMIFTGTNDTSKQAEKAQKVFSDLVQQNKMNPIVFVRMRNEKGNPVYLPLGILAAKSKNPILKKRIILVQPLPKERYPASTVSTEQWTFGVPEKLDKLTQQSDNALNMLRTAEDPRFLRDIDKLRGYFVSTSPSASDSKPEGVLVLAHQGGGFLWTIQDYNRISIPQIKRVFPPGSVAILSACSVAAASGNNQLILNALNENNIDAMIISPFPVDANYGTMLAVHILKSLEEAKYNNKEITMAELFSAATAKTNKYFDENMGINFTDMDLEFLIAGDYRIRIVP